MADTRTTPDGDTRIIAGGDIRVVAGPSSVAGFLMNYLSAVAAAVIYVRRKRATKR